MPFVVTAGRGRRVYTGSVVSDRARSIYPPAGRWSGSPTAAPTLARLARACLAAPLAGCALLLELDARVLAAARSGIAAVLKGASRANRGHTAVLPPAPAEPRPPAPPAPAEPHPAVPRPATPAEPPPAVPRPAAPAEPPPPAQRPPASPAPSETSRQAAATTQPAVSIPDDPRWHGIRREAKRLEKVRQRQEAARERQFLAEVRVPGAAHAREALIAAVHSLSNNRLRSFLTTTGIIIGTAAVIVLVALGNGMKTHFNAQFSRLANQITITSVQGSGTGGSVPRDLTDQDVAALRDPSLAPDIASVSPAMTGTVTLAAAQNQDRANLVGATDNYLELIDRKIVAGSWISSSRGSGGDRQAVLGQQVLTLLWGPGTDPHQVIGLPVRIDRTTFKVVGVLDSNGQNDNVGKVDQIIVKSTGVETIDRATRQIVEVLDSRHRIKSVNTRDYNVLTFTSLLEKSSQFINFLTMFIVAIAAISLLVGGIGVANIMLVSVTERTREIGIRKAIGATRRAIMRQFLSEAVMLTGLGGVMGVALGIGLTLAGGFLLPPAGSPDASDTNFPAPILTASPVVVAFAVSLIIGVLAGGYPAFRAARMRPIEALRFE